MADNKTSRVPRDSSPTATGGDYEFAYCPEKFAVRRTSLQGAVDAAGAGSSVFVVDARLGLG